MREIPDNLILYKGMSMYPTLKSMDMLMVVPYEKGKIRAGDVVVFTPPANCDDKITHRVIENNSDKIRTLGDNNGNIDRWTLEPCRIIGRVVYAQRGRRKIRIAGAGIGRLYAQKVRFIRRVKVALFTALSPLYHLLSENSYFLREFFKDKIRIISFDKPSGIEFQALMGSRLIARKYPKSEKWHIARPFRLFVDDVSLNRKIGKIGTVPISWKPQSWDSPYFSSGQSLETPVLEQSLFFLSEKLKASHAERILCGKRPNEILDLPDEALEFLISILKNDIPSRVPDFSPETRQKFISLLRPHYLLPLLYGIIGNLPENLQLSCDMKDAMRMAYLAASANFVKSENQLFKIVKTFEEAKIEVLVLKGAAFSRAIYKIPAMRFYLDIDLLVLPKDLKRARKVLFGLGYRSKGEDWRLINYNCEEGFINGITKEFLSLELHWHPHYFFPLSRNFKIENLFEEAVTIESTKFSFKTLNPVDAVLNSAIHAALTHRHEIKLIWLYDISLLMRTLANTGDLRRLGEKSVEWGATMALENSLRLAGLWTDFKMPEMNDFSLWGRSSKDERLIWSASNERRSSIKNELRMRLIKKLNLKEKLTLFFYFVFPPSSVMRRTYPQKARWLMPVSYIRRWVNLASNLFFSSSHFNDITNRERETARYGKIRVK